LAYDDANVCHGVGSQNVEAILSGHMIEGSEFEVAVYVGRHGAIIEQLECTKIACNSADYVSAFQLVYNRPKSADIDCHLEFGALYHVTNQDSPDTMAPHTMSGIVIGQIPNYTDTCNFFMLHNHQIIATNHFTPNYFEEEREFRRFLP
jgi:hypothetical protein